MRKELRENPVAYYLSACYAYEVLAQPIMTDAEFDELGQYIHDFWDLIEHRHKHFIEEESCHFTSAVAVPYYELPLIVLSATHTLLKTDFRASPIFKDAMKAAEIRDLV